MEEKILSEERLFSNENYRLPNDREKEREFLSDRRKQKQFLSNGTQDRKERKERGWRTLN